MTVTMGLEVDAEHLGRCNTGTVRICLFALRGYLCRWFGLLGFRVLRRAGVICS